MDDHDLGALLDASVPAQPASDAALTQIRRRAARRRHRSAVLSGTVAVAVIAVIALGVSWLGGSSKHVTPAGTRRCAEADVTMSIDTHPQVLGKTTRWAIIAANRSATSCRLRGTITATVSHTGSVAHTFSDLSINDPADYPSEIPGRASKTVANFAWNNPCSTQPVELEVTGIAREPARLALPRQPCTYGLVGTPAMLIEPPLVPGGPCPAGSITLTIDPDPERTGNTFHWAITGTARTDVVCRAHELRARIEHADGTVLSGVSGNPAVQNGLYQDLYSPSKPEIADYLSWAYPCSDGPAELVVTFSDGSNGAPARLTLPQQPCTAGAISRFKITGPTQFQIDTSTTTAKP